MQIGIQQADSAVSYRRTTIAVKDSKMALFAERLRARRDERGLTQREISALIGIDQGQYSRYEKGTVPTAEILVAIAVALECTTDYLLGHTDEPSKLREFESLPEDEKNMLIIYREYKKGNHIPKAAIKMLRDLNIVDNVEGSSVVPPKKSSASSDKKASDG